MSSRQMLRITLFGLLFIAVSVVFLFAVRMAGSREREAPLPQVTPAVSGEVKNAEGIPKELELLVVTPENVQTVIATLMRPETYSRELIVESFWDDGSAVYSFNIAVRNGVSALRTHSGGTAKNIIVTEEYTYIWYAGDRRPVTLRNTAGEKSDEYQKILTYEDILALDLSQIQNAGLTFDSASGPGIFVRYTSGELGYLTTCTISIELGLITQAEQYDGDTLIYRMSAGECSFEEPGISAFTLPTGFPVIGR